MHLINEIGIWKTYADSRYRDRGPLIFADANFLCTILKKRVSNNCVYA